MTTLPKLFKPFYTIPEAFNRLNIAGANLDKEEDLFLLADEGTIELSLIISEFSLLIKASTAEPHYFPRRAKLEFSPAADSVNFAINSLDYTEASLAMEVTRINHPSVMIPRAFYDGDIQESIISLTIETAFPDTEKLRAIAHQQRRHDELTKLGYMDEIITVSPLEPLVVKPLRIDSDLMNERYGEPRRYKFHRPPIEVLGATAAVELNNEVYYVCEAVDGTYISEVIDYLVKFKDGSFFRPVHKLNHPVVAKALREYENYVVTREALQEFEAKYLNHETVDSSVQQLSEFDLFTNPPMNNTDQFDFAREMTRKYIKKYSALPREPQLWNFIAEDERFELDTRNRIVGVGSKPIDRDNFKKNFKNWTRPKKI